MAGSIFSFPGLVETLEIEGTEPTPLFPWLEESWQKPLAFFDALFAHHGARFAFPSKSRPFEHYDFYHDAVLRHARSDRVALRWREGREWKELSYGDLHARCVRRSEQWLEAKVAPGKTVAIILPVGPDLLVALCTALRLGLVVSYLPPLGDRFLAKRLAAAKPDHVVTDPIYFSLLGPFGKKLLPIDPAPPALDEHRASHTYLSGEKWGRLFSPFEAAPHLPRTLAADDAYLRALRDGIVAFKLRPGDALAAPGLEPLQHQPALLLSALLCGATYIHVGVRELAAEPSLLEDFPIRALGIGRSARDALLRAARPPALDKTGSWFKCATEAADLGPWQQFARAVGLEKVPGANMHIEASSGGALVFSTKRRGGMHPPVLPAPGVPWTLLDLNGSGAPAAAPHGLFAPERTGAEATPSFSILAKHAGDYYFVGAMDPRRGGRTYPSEEVLACLEGLPFVAQAAVVPAPSGAIEPPWLFVLLVFVGAGLRGALAARRDGWAKEIEDRIARHMGEEFLPDRIEFFPFHARLVRDGDAVDEDWCRSQYLLGGLHKKANNEVDRRLADLRAAAIFGFGGGS